MVSAGNIVVTIFATAAIYYLWGMINGMQIISLTCLFRVRLPVNVYTINMAIMKFSSFDIF